MTDYDIRAMTEAEDKYTFSQSSQIASQTGLIGYLRADMDTDGNGFFSSWNDARSDLKTDEFKRELDEVINALREEGDILHDRTALAGYCYSHPQSKMDPRYSSDSYGVRVDTDSYAYLLRLNPNKGAYNLYCYCYRRDWLDRHMERARKGIRFIDPQYNELFRIPDGDRVKIINDVGDSFERTARYVDEYHVELGGSLCNTIYHICELAERMEKNGCTVIPLRSSLPEKCYVYVESTDEIGTVERGEKGYKPLGVKPEGNVSKKRAADYLNNSMGVTKAQAAAMSAGSMFGWDCKAADPANYDSEGRAISSYRSRGDAR
ncbi:MAG: hypothetical protein IJM44_08320 [Ruminococcus sp.]|nr:hypothetical protein [Ruminococcus sp.]